MLCEHYYSGLENHFESQAIIKWAEMFLLVAVFIGYNQYWPGGCMVLWILCPGAPEGSTVSGSDFKSSQKTGPWLKVSSNRLGEAGNKTCDPWFTRHSLILYTMAASN